MADGQWLAVSLIGARGQWSSPERFMSHLTIPRPGRPSTADLTVMSTHKNGTLRHQQPSESRQEYTVTFPTNCRNKVQVWNDGALNHPDKSSEAITVKHSAQSQGGGHSPETDAPLPPPSPAHGPRSAPWHSSSPRSGDVDDYFSLFNHYPEKHSSLPLHLIFLHSHFYGLHYLEDGY